MVDPLHCLHLAICLHLGISICRHLFLHFTYIATIFVSLNYLDVFNGGSASHFTHVLSDSSLQKRTLFCQCHRQKPDSIILYRNFTLITNKSESTYRFATRSWSCISSSAVPCGHYIYTAIRAFLN